MKQADNKEFIENLKRRGYVLINGCFYPPGAKQVKELQPLTTHNTSKKNNRSTGLKIASNRRRHKTAWIDDTLNIKNKTGRFDPFITMVRMDLQLDVWPEFYFTLQKQYRFDYAIPLYTDGRPVKIAIECDGGTQACGRSGHSSPAGIARDMDKGTIAAIEGWTLIRRTPRQLCTSETIELIKIALKNIL